MTGDNDRRQEPRLLVAEAGDKAFVRVVGKGTYRLAPSLKRFGEEVIRHGASQIIFDMRHCTQMDSTFMGVIAGLAARLSRERGGKIYMVNLTSHARGLLSTLGLDAVVHPVVAGTDADELRSLLGEAADYVELPSTAEPEARRSTMLEAHRELMKISPENAAQFQDVVEFLEKREREDSGGSP